MMTQTFESSELLLDIWNDVNESCFDSKLREPSSIGWINLSDKVDLEEPFGVYLPSERSIGISRRFYSLQAQHESIRAECAREPDEEKRQAILSRISGVLEIVYRLVAHEVAHQAVHESNGNPASHGDAFIAQAARIADAFGMPPPTHASAPAWPALQQLADF